MFKEAANKIHLQYCKFRDWQFMQDEDKINSDTKMRYILMFMMLLFDYGEDISILAKSDRYAAIMPLCRDFLECYAHTQNLIYRYNNDSDFNTYKEKIYVLELKQTQLMCKALNADKTIQGTAKTAIQNNLDSMETVLHDIFPTEYKQLNLKDLESSIYKSVERLCKKYGVDNDNIGKNIGMVLERNKILTAENQGTVFIGCHTIYSSLCNSSHSNISSMIQRTIQNGYLIPNTPQENVEVVLSVIAHCMEDSISELKELR